MFDLSVISQKFLSALPLVELDVEVLFDKLCDAVNGIPNQEALISVTVDHPLVLKYPLKPDYQRLFIRTLIHKLEEAGVEVSDRLYSKHCELLISPATDLSYRHYTLHDHSYIISLMESVNLISNGTTGLRTWEASHILISWCFEHASILRGARLLELGSGIGLCGLAISLICQPSLYCFSDCHPHVLEKLPQNLNLNTNNLHPSEKWLADSLEKRTLWMGNIKDTKAAVLDLPWEDIPSTDLTSLSPDFIIASDVVYDQSSFDALSSAIDNLAQSGAQIVIASTERNPETLLEFLNCLYSKGLFVEELEVPKMHVLPMPLSTTAVKIHRITCNKNSEFKVN